MSPAMGLVAIALAAGCGDSGGGDNNNNHPVDAAVVCEWDPDCDDDDDCTRDWCNPQTARCEYLALDGDGDGFGSSLCGGADCDDEDPSVFPGAPEVCDGTDNDCDGNIPAPELDGDGDGFSPCGVNGPASADCNDSNADIHPGAREICGNGIDENCNNLVDGLDLACANPPSNDACVAPEALPLTTTIQASTLAASNDLQGSCGGDAPEVVYSLSVQGLWNLTARVDTLDPDYDPLLYLRRECDNPGAEVACVDNSDGLVPIVTLRAPPVGQYHLFVDGATHSDIGDFELSLSATPVVNDACPDAVDVSVGGVWYGSTDNLTDHYAASCGSGAPGLEAVFFFTLTQPRHVNVSMAAPSYGYSVLYLQTECGNPATEVACVDDWSIWTPGTIDMNLGAGTYYLFVDGIYDNYHGDYELAVAFSMQ